MIDFDAVCGPTIMALVGAGATYASPTGESTACMVRQHQGRDARVSVGDAEVMRERVLFDVRASEVSAPTVGGVFVVDGSAYTVTAPPARMDSRRLVWTCDCTGAVNANYRIATGAGATLNPPAGSPFKIAANAPAGATALTIAGTVPTGRFLAGDALAVGGNVYVVTAPVSAASGKFTAVPISPALVAAVAVDDAVIPSFACDHIIPVTPAGWTQVELAAGANMSDRRLIIPHAALAPFLSEPSTSHFIVFGGSAKGISAYSAIYQGSSPIAWDVRVKS